MSIPNPSAELGARWALARRNAGLSFEQACDAICVLESNWCQPEITRANAEKWGKIYGVTHEYLLGLDPPAAITAGLAEITAELAKTSLSAADRRTIINFLSTCSSRPPE